jgi:hypothetical protein
MTTFHVLGTAPSIKQYINEYNCFEASKITTIGVNDIYKYIPTDYLLLMDAMDTFSPERLEIIKKSNPASTFSNLPEWDFMPNFTLIGLNPVPGSVASLGYLYSLPRHVDSTFTAVAIAYSLGAKEIIMYGVDFYKHSSLMAYEEQILLTYANMLAGLRKRGVKLFIGNKKSLLAKVLPVYKQL